MLHNLLPGLGALTSSVGLSLVSSLVGAATVVLIRVSVRRARLNAARRFWRTFAGEALIMTTEYRNETITGAPSTPSTPIIRSDSERDQFIASQSTSGYFLSYGVAMALSQLIAYLERDLQSRVTVIGDKGHSQPSNGKSLIVLGSPANNRYLPRLIDHVALEFPLLGHFRWAVDPDGVSLKLPSGQRLVSDVDDHETGTDYALVISVTQRRGAKRRLVLVSGCGMWGTEAAARFLLDRESLRSMPRGYRGNPHAMVFVIKAWISRGRPDRVELYSSQGWPIVMDPRSLKNVPAR